jgi:hypothetical protein
MTAKTGEPGQDSRDRTDRTKQPGKDRRDRIALPNQDKQNGRTIIERLARQLRPTGARIWTRIGQLDRQYSRNRTVRTGQPKQHS